jgi:hypothetical protein
VSSDDYNSSPILLPAPGRKTPEARERKRGQGRNRRRRRLGIVAVRGRLDSRRRKRLSRE